MEDLVDPQPLKRYQGLHVLVTGDTGFKGSWLCAWLLQLGARITGMALPPTAPSHFDLLELQKHLRHIDVDIRDHRRVREIVGQAKPDVVFHLAAQALVRESYADPVRTFATNTQGTAHVLEAVRGTDSVRAAVVITSDKCYENREWTWAYRENDRLGGHDPYSASKAAAELVVDSFRKSYFGPKRPELGVASARAGNVIGGGDWSKDRLIPDCARTLLAGETLTLRHPRAVRPWQHVLEPLGGYLLLGARLLASPSNFSQAYNFGPDDHAAVDVEAVANRFRARIGNGEIALDPSALDLHEASQLRLACEKARTQIGFRPILGISTAIDWTVDWYRTFNSSPMAARDLTSQQLRQYMQCLESTKEEP